MAKNLTPPTTKVPSKELISAPLGLDFDHPPDQKITTFQKIINLFLQKVTFFSRFRENRDIFELPGALKLLISIFIFLKNNDFTLQRLFGSLQNR